MDNFSTDEPVPGESGPAELAGPEPSPDPAAAFHAPFVPAPPIPEGEPGMLLRALAGLHAGIVGVFLMFGCFFIASIWNGRGIWAVPNLFSTVFYGDNAYQYDFLRTTWSGIALIIALYGLLGAAWGCVWGSQRKPLFSLLGAVAGLAVYYLFFAFIWNYVDSLIPLYAPVRQFQVAHILWGAALARSPGYLRNLMSTLSPTTDSAAVASQDPADQDPAESVSGEVIR